MTVEARLAFLIFFFTVWCLVGLIPWALAAVLVRGRGALPALPIALAAACVGGVAVPLVGLRDAGGLLLSIPAAVVAGALGSWAGVRLARRLQAEAAPAPQASERPPAP